MICPKCELEYVKGVTVCPDCNTKLVNKEEFEGNLLHPKDWVVVYSCDNVVEADMLKSNLKGANIEAIILNQSDSSFPAVGDLSGVKVLVKDKDSQDALAIINDINSRS